jgi:hypothetical protein
MVAAPPLKVPDAPDAGAVNVTLTPGTGLLNVSLRVTARAFGKSVKIGVD